MGTPDFFGGLTSELVIKIRKFSKMFQQPTKKNNILGIVLIVLGMLAIFVALGEFLFRIAIGIFGIYLIYSGLKLRNQHHKISLLFSMFGGGPFGGRGPFGGMGGSNKFGRF